MSEFLFPDNPFLLLFGGDPTEPDPITNDHESADQGTPMNTWHLPSSGIREQPMFHVENGRPYHEENSRQGIAEALQRNFRSIDLDMHKTKPDDKCKHHTPGAIDYYPGRCWGHFVNTHWSKPMLQDGFRDPLGKLSKDRTIESMTLDQVMRLRAGKNDEYQIEPMSTQFRRCSRAGLVASAEGKWQTGNEWYAQQLYREAVQARCLVIFKSAYDGPVAAAKKAGFQTRYTKDHK